MVALMIVNHVQQLQHSTVTANIDSWMDWQDEDVELSGVIQRQRGLVRSETTLNFQTTVHK